MQFNYLKACLKTAIFLTAVLLLELASPLPSSKLV